MDRYVLRGRIEIEDDIIEAVGPPDEVYYRKDDAKRCTLYEVCEQYVDYNWGHSEYVRIINKYQYIPDQRYKLLHMYWRDGSQSINVKNERGQDDNIYIWLWNTRYAASRIEY